MSNRLSRREMFKVLLGAAATVTICRSTALADALEQHDWPELKQYIEMAKTIIANADRRKNVFQQPDSYYFHPIATSGYYLLSDGMKYFPPTKNTLNLVKQFVVDPPKFIRDHDTLNEEELAQIARELIVPAVINEIVVEKDIYLHLFLSGKFEETYGGYWIDPNPIWYSKEMSRSGFTPVFRIIANSESLFVVNQETKPTAWSMLLYHFRLSNSEFLDMQRKKFLDMRWKRVSEEC